MTTPPDPVPPVRTSRTDRWLTRHGVVGTTRRDALLAALVALATAVTLPAALTVGLDGGPAVPGAATTAVLTALCVVQCLVLALRRTRPEVCLLAVAALQVAVVAATPDGAGVRGVAPLLAAYAVATVLPGRAAVRVVAAAVVLELVGSVAVTAPAGDLLDGLAGVAGGVATYLGAAAVGVHVRGRRLYVDLVRRHAADLEASQVERTRAAVAGVRTRMAREVHDIAAHHLSAMVVQATATARLVDRDPGATRAGLLAIRAQGRRTLEDLRLLVGILRDPATAEDAGPVPGLGVLDDLVAEARALGDDVRVVRTDDGLRLGHLADVTAYRMVQEALSNARQHAPGAPVVVEVAPAGSGAGTRDDGAVALTVTNGRPARSAGGAGGRASGGVGLLGMRERVDLVGGRLDVGPTDAGGWRVRAELPGEPGPPDAPEGTT
ncbi:sensor histidine kinase [Nocardioides alkalitolerans]|uniref:sensor histidine kinase n=1 Tax=Nocardioides alkalitolerans TaxID=281714 RepID=UPI000404E20A|nr:histidine kinase [Nocardioides alkalitolerans]